MANPFRLIAKFAVGEAVFVDGSKAVVTQIIYPEDFKDLDISYAVTFPKTDEWGTFTEKEIINETKN